MVSKFYGIRVKKKKNLISCHFCGSNKINISIMVLYVNNFINNKIELLALKRQSFIIRKIKNFQNFVKNNFKYAGNNFAHKA